MMPGRPRWPIFISILRTSKSKNSATCFLLSSFNSQPGLIPAVTSSPDSILLTIAELGSPMIMP